MKLNKQTKYSAGSAPSPDTKAIIREMLCRQLSTVQMSNSLMTTAKEDCYKGTPDCPMTCGEKAVPINNSINQSEQLNQNETSANKLFRFEIDNSGELQVECGNDALEQGISQMIKNNANTAEADIKG